MERTGDDLCCELRYARVLAGSGVEAGDRGRLDGDGDGDGDDDGDDGGGDGIGGGRAAIDAYEIPVGATGRGGEGDCWIGMLFGAERGEGGEAAACSGGDRDSGASFRE